jgi:glycosyltransferase involved in cell wall biosynthesis
MENMHCPTDRLSLFFPAYNDAGSIQEVVMAYYAEARRFAAEVEVIVVNDGSRDGTGEILEALARELPDLRVIHHPTNRGYGAALITGFGHCAHDLIFYTDGDGQYRPDDMQALFAALDPDTDVVNGYKTSRADGWVRGLTGWLYRVTTRVFFGIRLRDIDCDYRLIRRRAMEGLSLTSHTGVICTEMVYKWQRKGCRIVEVPVSHFRRRHGRSQFFTFRHLSNAAVGLARLWLRLQSGGNGPLKPASAAATPRTVRRGVTDPFR